MRNDRWFSEFERLVNEGASYESACDRAGSSMVERLYDHADYLRKRAREEGCRPEGTPPSKEATHADTGTASQHQSALGALPQSTTPPGEQRK